MPPASSQGRLGGCSRWQVPALRAELTVGGAVEQTHTTLKNGVASLGEAGAGLDDGVRCGVWLEDPRDFWSFNK
ncbi:hypothetical protein B1218_33695, partial [Pseudomonas ogarae]